MADVRTLQGAEALLRHLVADLEDCIAEVEGKSYLKDYTRAAYETTLLSARAFLALPSPDASAGGEWTLSPANEFGAKPGAETIVSRHTEEVYQEFELTSVQGARDLAAVLNSYQSRLNAHTAAPAQAGLREALEGLITASQALVADYRWSDRHRNGGYAEEHPITGARAAITVARAALGDEQGAAGEANDA